MSSRGGDAELYALLAECLGICEDVLRDGRAGSARQLQGGRADHYYHRGNERWQVPLAMKAMAAVICCKGLHHI